MKDPAFWGAMAAGLNNQPLNSPPTTLSPQSAPATIPSISGIFRQYEGAKIVAQDGKFLGIISSNRFDAESIANPYGEHGSKYSALSIFNQYGDYGSPYAEYSPWNPYSQKPPLILATDGTRYFLTKNSVLSGIDPSIIRGLVESIQSR
jgi:hypothetical protein